MMEHLLHFTMGPQCRNSVLSSASSTTTARLPRGGARQSFFALLADVIRRKCGMTTAAAAASRLVCDRCLSVTGGPVEYAMHRDMHRPALGDLFPCQFCGLLFR